MLLQYKSQLNLLRSIERTLLLRTYFIFKSLHQIWLTWWNIYKGEQLDISGDINETINQDAFEWHGSYDLKSEPCDFIEANPVSHDIGDLFIYFTWNYLVININTLFLR